MTLPVPVSSATIDGKISNHVTIKRAKQPRVNGVRRGMYFDADRAVHGKPYQQVCISLPVEELAEIDRIASVLRRSRSSLFRLAIAELRRDLVARRVAGIVG